MAVAKGTTAQTVTKALSADKKSAVLTLGTNLVAADYTVSATPAGGTAINATVKGEAAKLSEIKFASDKLVLKDSATFTIGSVIVTGADQWGGEVALNSSKIKFYPSVSATTTYKDKVLTITRTDSLYWQVGNTLSVTAVYTDGTNVVQANKTLTVSNAAYVASIEFGTLNTTDKALQGKRVTLKNFAKGTYYVPVTAKDQYGTALKASELTAMQSAGTLFIVPTQADAVYAGYKSFDTLDDGTVIMYVAPKASGALPGTATITATAVGGATKTTSFKIEDNPYIDKLNASISGDVYEDSTAEITVSATDQYGDAANLYDMYDATKTAATSGKKIVFNDTNALTQQTSYISVNNGTLSAKVITSTKTVKFYYKAGSTAGTDVMTIASATPTVSTQTITVGKKGTLAGISKTLNGTDETTLAKGQSFNFDTNLTFLDSNGLKWTGTAPTYATAADVATADAGVAVSGNKDKYYYTIVPTSGDKTATSSSTVTPNQTTKYEVQLYQITEGTKTGSTKTYAATAVGSVASFTITVTDKEAGKDYASYTATVKAGDELLNAGTADVDNAKIIVKGKDSNGVEATLTPGTDYTLTVDNTTNFAVESDVIGTVNDNGTYIGCKTAYETWVNATESTHHEGKVTVTVWSKDGKTEVASVQVPYSNKTAGAVSANWTKQVIGTDTDPVAITDDTTIDVSSDASLTYTTGQKIVVTSNNDPSTGKTTEYTLNAVNQYGQLISGSTFLTGGVASASVGDMLDGVTYTVKMTNASVNKTVKFAVAGAKAAAALTNLTFANATEDMTAGTKGTFALNTHTDQYGDTFATTALASGTAMTKVTGSETATIAITANGNAVVTLSANGNAGDKFTVDYMGKTLTLIVGAAGASTLVWA